MLALLVTLTLASPCRPNTTEIVVTTASHRLTLCNKGSAEAEYQVALGSGGLDKRVEGDAKTPLGTYALAAPRASSSFHTFIYVGYPTPEQKKAGYTGDAIGVHGPPRSSVNLGSANVAVDWTLGCIALASDPEIDAVAAWVKRVKCGRIRLE